MTPSSNTPPRTPPPPLARWNTFGAVSGSINPSLYTGIADTAAPNAVTLTASSTALTWTAVTTSADGTVAFAAATTGGLYTTTNAGYSSTAVAGFPGSGFSVADVKCDADCSVVVAVGGTSGQTIYASSNAGVSWVAVTPAGATAFTSVAVNADGSVIYAAGSTSSGLIFKSTNGGASFSSVNALVSGWLSIDTDNTGTKLIASAGAAVAGTAGKVYTSADSGTTLTESYAFGATALPIVTLGGTATRAAAGDSAATVGGLRTAACDASMVCTWTELVAHSANSAWTGLDMSADSLRLAAVNSGAGVPFNGRYTYTYGLPTASIWQQTTLVAGASGLLWTGVAIADNAAQVYTVGGSNNQFIGIGSGQ